jgi:methionine-R-sulfoxide reductase
MKILLSFCVLLALLVAGAALVESRAADSAKPAKGPAKSTPKPKDKKMVSVKVFDTAGKLVGPLDAPKVALSDSEWKKRLTPEQYKIVRAKGTERPFCGTLLDNKLEGVYTCVGCGLPLFSSDSKFHSGTGWPSFFQPIATENIAEHIDRSHGQIRTEILCARCGGHLGHVFDDGPQPTNLRYCLNSESLSFTKSDELTKLADPITESKTNAKTTEKTPEKTGETSDDKAEK